MRIIICGDTHIGAVFGLGRATKDGGNTRIDDYERTLNYIVDHAIQSGADAFIQTGDAFDSRNPAPEHLNVLNRALRRLSMANITSIIIMGNHDYRKTGDTFTSAISSLAAKDYPNVRVVLSPEIIKLHGPNKTNASLILIPYRDKRMYTGKNTEENSLLYEAEVKGLISQCEPGSPIVAVGHNFYHTGSYNDYGGAEVLARTEAFAGCDLVAMGHYHQFKIISKRDPIAIYTGSMEKLNFGDQDVDKVFIDFDTATKRTKVMKCPSRLLEDISINLSEADHNNFIDLFKEKVSEFDLTDRIVRVKIIIRDNLAPFIKKHDIEKILYGAGSFYISKVAIEPIVTRMVRDEAILNHKDDYAMFEAFLRGQASMDEDERLIILAEAKKIMV
jgi:DNA repair protein SbcD/Mre11